MLSFYLLVELSRCTHVEDRVTSQATGRVLVLWFNPVPHRPAKSLRTNRARSHVHSAPVAPHPVPGRFRETTITCIGAKPCRQDSGSYYRGVEITRKLPTRSCDEPQFSEPVRSNTESYVLAVRICCFGISVEQASDSRDSGRCAYRTFHLSGTQSRLWRLGGDCSKTHHRRLPGGKHDGDRSRAITLTPHRSPARRALARAKSAR
jgi:hypothetical protein